MILRTLTAAALATALLAGTASAQEAKHYRFAYDQPRTTGYGVAADIFAAKLKELSKGAFLIDQYPGAQLGQEPQVLQLLKSGDIDFAITSSANTATVSPQAGVMSLHFLFRSEDHLRKAIGDPGVAKAVRDMIEETVQGAHVIEFQDTCVVHDAPWKRDSVRGHVQPALAVSRQSTRVPVTAAICRDPFRDVGTRGIEHFYPMVPRVGEVDPPVIHGNPQVAASELARAGAATAP